jgi:UDP:flavonoid glycosyltransferase YjiC (YdhE family)
MKNGDELRSDKLNLIPISKYVVERSPYWEDINILTGYWYGEEPEYIPDSKLSDFIEAGEKPAILALGAMSFEDRADKAKLDMFVNAFQKTGCRAVIQGFQKTLQDYDLPDTVIACGNVPHSWLFRQGSFVIHHCGFGTTAASIIYGIPSIPVPHVLDQLGFAMQLEKCGVATTHIDAKDLSEEKIVKAIEEMKKDCHIKKHNAEMISEKIRTEGGVDEAVRQIIRITVETDLRKQFR